MTFTYQHCCKIKTDRTLSRCFTYNRLLLYCRHSMGRRLYQYPHSWWTETTSRWY